MTAKQKFIDATNLRLGRMASCVAKDALLGDELFILNAEKAVISGNSKKTISDYLEKMQNIGTRYKGPFFPKRADRIVKRVVRGMLPFHQPRGREAFKRVRVYAGIPDEFKSKKLETIESAKHSAMERRKYISIGELSKYIGGK